MSKLTDEQIEQCRQSGYTNKGLRSAFSFEKAARAIESAATEPLLQRIAELEQRNSDLHEDVQRFKKHALNEKAARLELERLLEEACKDAERYRWLRDLDEDPVLSLAAQYTDMNGSATSISQRIDAAIDAAMQKGQS